MPLERAGVLACLKNRRAWIETMWWHNGEACTKARRDSLAMNLGGFDSHPFHNASLPEWLMGRSAKPLFTGSIPVRSSLAGLAEW